MRVLEVRIDSCRLGNHRILQCSISVLADSHCILFFNLTIVYISVCVAAGGICVGIEVAFKVADGGLRPKIPFICPEPLKELIEQCWDDDWRKR